MIVGTVRETKDIENRVGLIPSFVSLLVNDGHEVMIETMAGYKSGFTDDEYLKAGAEIISRAEDVYECSDIVVKVKEPQPNEYSCIRENQVIFSYLHLAPNLNLLKGLIDSKAVCIAYETVGGSRGNLPLLEPISTIAGRMSIIVAANLLQIHNNGSGTLISGVPGVTSANVAIIGGGVVGSNAAFMAYGMGADVTILDDNIQVLRKIERLYRGRAKTIFSNAQNIMTVIKNSDIVIGSVLIHGAEAPKVISRDMVKIMQHGSVIIDVSIDQGGCAETSRVTTLSDPTYEVDGVIHYCVPNMTAAFAKTASIALGNSTFPYIQTIAKEGYQKALLSDSYLRSGLNVYKGNVTHKVVAEAHGLPYVDPCQLLK
jgi:alanine dehydrogenase